MKASTLIRTEKMQLIFEAEPGDDTPEEDRTLNLTVNPGALTPAKEAKIREADDEDSAPLAALLTDLVSEWDMLDEEGQVIGLDLESLMNTPTIVLALVVNEIGKHLEAKAAEQGKA